jgi:MEMO1 family protein
MIRQPVVAGKFYEYDKDNLIIQIKDCFTGKFGPGKLNQNVSKEKIKAIIVPHAGYFFSGSCAAHAYKKVAESTLAKTFVLIGLNHYGHHSGISNQDWQTPLGIIETNKELVDEITNTTSLEINEEPHEKEHSIEVQIPFLQYINKDNDFDIVCISLGNIDPEKLGTELFDVLNNKDVTLIISSDFTHYGHNFNYVPFTDNIKQNLELLDNGAIKYIENFDAERFRKYLNETHITICGYVPILTSLYYMKNYKGKSAKLLKYYTSGDVLGDFKNSVSYVSILIK